MSLAALAILIVLAGLMAYVRLAPTDAADWHIDLTGLRPAGSVDADGVQVLRNGAWTELAGDPATATAMLAAMDAAAMATPRTRRLAGSVTEGRITWETRSLIWGFPDYTTAQITPSGLLVFARQRFGGQDSGVNARRLRGWLAAIPPASP